MNGRPKRALERQRFDRLIADRSREVPHPEGVFVRMAETHVMCTNRRYSVSRAPITVPRVRWMEKPFAGDVA